MAIPTVKGTGFEYYLWGDGKVTAFWTLRDHQFKFSADVDNWEIEVADINRDLPSDGDAYGYVNKGMVSGLGHASDEEAVTSINVMLTDRFAAMD
jgi:hypothetical protein